MLGHALLLRWCASQQERVGASTHYQMSRLPQTILAFCQERMQLNMVEFTILKFEPVRVLVYVAFADWLMITQAWRPGPGSTRSTTRPLRRTWWAWRTWTLCLSLVRLPCSPHTCMRHANGHHGGSLCRACAVASLHACQSCSYCDDRQAWQRIVGQTKEATHACSPAMVVGARYVLHWCIAG